MTEQEKIPSEKPVEVILPVKSNSNVAIVFVGVLVLGALTLFGLKQHAGHFASPAAQSTITNVVYLDMGGIISAATKKFIEESKKETGKNDPTASGKEFSNQMAALLDEYRRADVLVLDRRYVVAAPDGHDITNEVAAKLDLVLDK
ncbi:MAG: hypothetical protein PHQ60_02015 [Sideroxydans sp.]|nr:hypothetical protein [Sideroxydans sp.]MDD5056618.1 hypothetical protein [Sideroxydans sp.]